MIRTALFVLCLKANEQVVLQGKKMKCSGFVGFTEFLINSRKRGDVSFVVSLWF